MQELFVGDIIRSNMTTRRSQSLAVNARASLGTVLNYSKNWLPPAAVTTNVLEFNQAGNCIDWGANQNAAQDWDLSFRFDMGNLPTHWMPFCNATATHYLLFEDDTRIYMKIAGTSYDLTGLAVEKRWSHFKNGMIEWQFKKVGTTLSIYVNRQLYFTATIPDTAFQWRYFGKWSGGTAYDGKGWLEWVKIDGVTYNAANTWNGKTLTNLSAATRSYGEEFQSFMVTGQSNAVSRNNEAANAFTGITFPIALSKYWNNAVGHLAYEDTIFGINQQTDVTGNWGVEYRLANNLSLASIDHRILKYAVGSTSMSVWSTYVGYMALACQMAAKSGIEYKTVIFIQGETDATNEALSLAYEANLRLTIKIMRMMLTNGFNTKFIYLKLVNFSDTSQIYRANVQAAQEAVKNDVNVKMIVAPANWSAVDDTHFDAVTIDNISTEIWKNGRV